MSPPSAASSKPRRWARRSFRVTRPGRFFLLVTVGVGVAAVNTGNNLLYLVLGLMLSLIVLSGVMSEIAIARVRPRRILPGRLFAETPFLMEVVLANQKHRFASFSLEVEDLAHGEKAAQRVFFLKVAPGRTESVFYRRVIERRGRCVFDRIRVSTRFPFGLIEKSETRDVVSECLAYPAPLVGSYRDEREAVAEVVEASSSERLRGGVEIVGLRDYAVGDTIRAIHWRRTASLGRTVVRDRRQDDVRRVVLRIDNRVSGDPQAWTRDFELRIRRAAWVAAELLRRGAAVRIVAWGSESPTVLGDMPPDALWRFLALLGPSASGAATPTLGHREQVVEVHAP